MKATVAIIVLFLFVVSCSTNQPGDEKKSDINQVSSMEGEDMVKRGNYLVTIAGCNDCHSPKIMTQRGPVIDSSKILSGHPANIPVKDLDAAALKPGNWMQMSPDLTAFVGPWGVSFPANLTPDSATGIGAWGGDVFIKTLRTGKHLGQENGREILPPMPWQEFAKMTDEDLKAVYSYLLSLPPVNNRVPAPLSPPDAAKLAKK